MTDEVMEQMNDVLSRLEGRLDSMEKGELPPALQAAMDKKKGKGDDKESKDDKKEMKDDDKDDKEKSEFSDVITSEYLDWMENTLKSAGVNTGQARQHFDNIAKENLGSTPESIGDGADYFAGQVKGRVQEGGNPSTNAISRTTGGGGKKDVAKSDFITGHGIDSHRIEEAYGVFKAAKQEEQFRNNLEHNFEGRFAQESHEEISKAQAQDFDARAPLDEVMKALGALNDRINNISNGSGEMIAKSVTTPALEVPSTQDLANMTWEEVHQLAGGLYRSE